MMTPTAWITRALLAMAAGIVAACAEPPIAQPPASPSAPEAPSTAAPEWTPALRDRVDALAQVQMRQRRIPGLAYGIVRGGVLVHHGWHGISDLAHGAPVKAETIFDLASLTKAMTAAGILLLVEEGKLHLDDSIALYLDDPPEAWREMTVRHLLTHVSGMAAPGHDFSGGRGAFQDPSISAADAYAAARVDALAFAPPGTRFVYSNAGYFVLGMVLERAAGQPFRAFMTERVFAHLGMEHTLLKDSRRIVPNEARGYTLHHGEWMHVSRWHTWEIPAAKDAMSTVADLALWVAALDDDRLLGAASRREMFTPATLADGSSTGYGFGWYLREQRGHRVQEHRGITGTEILRLPDSGLGVIVLTNLGLDDAPGSEAHSWGIAQQIASLLVPGFGRPPLVAVPIPPATASEWTGEYDNNGVRWTFFARGDEIWLRMEETDIRLIHVGDGVFEEADEDIRYIAERDPSGRIAAIRAEGIAGWTERATPITSSPTVPGR